MPIAVSQILKDASASMHVKSIIAAPLHGAHPAAVERRTPPFGERVLVSGSKSTTPGGSSDSSAASDLINIHELDTWIFISIAKATTSKTSS